MAKVRETTLDEFEQDPGNANVGTKAGAQLLENSFARHKAGRSLLADAEKILIAGNKSQQAAQNAGIKKVVVVETDGTEIVVVQRTDLHQGDPERESLALFDNRTSEIGLRWNPSAIKAKFEAGVDLSKLWNKQQLDQLLKQAKLDDEPKGLDDVSEELPGAQALKPTMQFSSENLYGIPNLMPEQLAGLPEQIDVWAGQDASDLDWEGWWLYCYGSDSMRGLDVSRSILAFYVDDYRFARWWEMPDVYVAKAINAGFQICVTPNFSLYGDEPLAVHIYEVYRARWLGRYMQEAGMFVIPDVEWGVDEDLEFCMEGVPKGAPCISIEIHALGSTDQSTLNHEADNMRHVIDTLEPQSVMIYGGGKDLKMAFAGAVPDGVPVTWIESRVIRRGKRAMSHVMENK